MEDLSCAFIRPQTSARTQPPNEVLSSATMIVYFVYFSDNTDFTLVLRLLMLQFIVELVIITQNCFSSSLVGKQCIK